MRIGRTGGTRPGGHDEVSGTQSPVIGAELSPIIFEAQWDTQATTALSTRRSAIQQARLETQSNR